MAPTTDNAIPKQHSRLRYVGFTIAFLVVAVILLGAWMAYKRISFSLQAEKNLHATLYTIRLVEQFVRENGRWPETWYDLEQIKLPGDSPWPTDSKYLQERVAIDFSADLNMIIKQDPMEFEAIKPKGPYYVSGIPGYIELLQETIKNKIAEGQPD